MLIAPTYSRGAVLISFAEALKTTPALVLARHLFSLALKQISTMPRILVRVFPVNLATLSGDELRSWEHSLCSGLLDS